MKKEKSVKLKNTKQNLLDILNSEELFNKDSDWEKKEEKIEKINHEHEDHYHGLHHFDKYGNHDDVDSSEFTIKAHFSKTKKSITFRISMTALILALAIAMSFIDSLLEKFSINIGGVGFEMRILDILVIVVGIPIVGIFGSITIAIIEPWFHFLIDSDHVPLQIALDSLGYVLTVLIFFSVFYLLFKNSPIHKDPNRTRNIFKITIPSLIIVPVLSIIFTAIFVLSLYLTYKTNGESEAAENWDNFMKMFSVIFFANFGIQIVRFGIMYTLFVLVESKMKPINHRYR